MALKNIGIDLFKNIMAEARHNPDLLDSYSPNQFKSKENLISYIDMLPLENPDIVILGCWYGSILIPTFAETAKRITAIDLDKNIIGIAKNRLFNYENIDFISSDVFDNNRYGRILNANLIINTSCEHMNPMNELKALNKSNGYFAFQSNDMFNIPTHINCVKDINEFRDQLPINSQVIFEDEVKDDRGTRFTIIGKLCAE
tara:strand:+ start:1988 stop:2590 length:603 start_codon:yes stop_codon:yes gene_type:complete